MSEPGHKSQPPAFGNLNGFAYNGINYIDKATAGTHTMVTREHDLQA